MKRSQRLLFPSTLNAAHLCSLLPEEACDLCPKVPVCLSLCPGPNSSSDIGRNGPSHITW